MQPKTFLFVLWEGGGNVPPLLGLAKRMIARGHKAIVISDPCNEQEARAAGCDFFPYTTAPHRYDKSAESTILKDYEAGNTVKGFQLFLDHIACGPALQYAQDVLHILNTQKIDAVVVNEALYGGCFAAELRQIPCAMVIPGTSSFPAPGMPPPGMFPQHGLIGKLLDSMSSFIFKKLIAHGLPSFNEARKELGLAPLSDIIAYTYSFPRRLLVMTSPDFEYPANFPPNVRITGPILDDPFVSETGENFLATTSEKKLLLVSLSTTFQNQAGILQNVVDAVGRLPYQGFSYFRSCNGSKLEKHSTECDDPIIYTSFTCAAKMCCGCYTCRAWHRHPLTCIWRSGGMYPYGKRPTANAARVVYRRVGLRLNKKAAAKKIAGTIHKVVKNPEYRKKHKSSY